MVSYSKINDLLTLVMSIMILIDLIMTTLLHYVKVDVTAATNFVLIVTLIAVLSGLGAAFTERFAELE